MYEYQQQCHQSAVFESLLSDQAVLQFMSRQLRCSEVFSCRVNATMPFSVIPICSSFDFKSRKTFSNNPRTRALMPS
jgi:hypothetical protein